MISLEKDEQNQEKILKAIRDLNKIKYYIENGQSKDIREAIEGLFSERTLRNWINDPSKAVLSSNIQKKDVLAIAVRRLETRFKIDHVQMYDFAVRELGTDSDPALAIKKYEGTYHIFSSIPETSLKILNLRVHIDAKNIPIFFLKASLMRNVKMCDGLVFDTGSHIIMSGLSTYINAFLTIKKVPDPWKDAIHGVITIENRLNRECYSSEIHMVHVANDKILRRTQKEILSPAIKI
ncbi:hypothetical protein GCM10010520_23170 [Rhizobium viscosum]|uniref:Uncharacterized protein n=1 Tax=Rhizobium viscosum TaxID=1673 RepID=A0ABR9IIT5_RHIVS|nr:hypothetical protein [Rhizobium viscosum]MBE1503089.1 hypothetical protein [Rhizobium viscosum]